MTDLDAKIERRRAKDRAYHVANRDRELERMRACYAANKDARLAYGREYRAKNKDRQRAYNIAIRERRRERDLRLKYGITPDQWQAMFEAQGLCCRICNEISPGKKGWRTDHCHKSGIFRGILCHQCNIALGMFNDKPGVLREAALYLEEFGEKPSVE